MQPLVLQRLNLHWSVHLYPLLCSSRLCQQHFEMGCRIKSKLAISLESSSLPCSAVQAQSHANPAQLVNQNVPGKQASSTIGDSGLNIQTSMDFATATETQKVRLCAVRGICLVTRTLKRKYTIKSIWYISFVRVFWLVLWVKLLPVSPPYHRVSPERGLPVSARLPLPALHLALLVLPLKPRSCGTWMTSSVARKVTSRTVGRLVMVRKLQHFARASLVKNLCTMRSKECLCWVVCIFCNLGYA